MTPLIRWIRSYGLQPRRGRALFLDRDGVINELVRDGYVLQWEEFLWRPGVIDVLSKVSSVLLPIVIVTNQSCIGRGLTTADAIESLMIRVVASLEEAGICVSAWYCCPHAPHEGCGCRKPEVGMLRAAAADMNLDLASSYLIGDSDGDIAAGKAVGCQTWKIHDAADFSVAVDEILERERCSLALNKVPS